MVVTSRLAGGGGLFVCASSVTPPSSRRHRDGGAGGLRGGDGGYCSVELSSPTRWRRWPERITSVSNPFVKHCVKLRLSSSYRRSCASAIVVGLNPILEICRFEKLKDDKCSMVDCLLLLDDTGTPEELHYLSPPVVKVSPSVMKKISGLDSSDSIEAIALMRIPWNFFSLDEDEELYEHCFPSPHRILVLDGIQDPGNLGTLIRSALAFKWDGAFLLPTCCDPFNEKALRAARGASFQLPIVSGHWSHLIALRTKFQMKMLAGHPENFIGGSNKISSLTLQFAVSMALNPLCLVLGSEGHGLSEQSVQACELVSIPMAGFFESLNVSVAGGIFLYMLQPEPQLQI